MKRRQFINYSAQASLGLCLSSPVYAFDPALINNSRDTKVLIVGAGAAGLYAGYLLNSKGIPYSILEASDRYGGRLGKLDGFADFPLDLGAEWLHGKKSLVKKIIKQSKARIIKDNSDEFYWYKNQIVKKLPQYFYLNFAKSKNLPDISYQTYAAQEGYGEDYQFIIEQIAGDYGADSSDLSVKWNALESYEWSSGNKDYKFEQTYFDLVDQNIARPLVEHIQLNTAVKTLDYSQDKLRVYDNLGQVHIADKVLITVPISILKEGAIEFIPQLPESKVEAFQKIGMGAGMKVFLKFKDKFYHPNLAGGKICAAYVDESIGKKGKDHILMAFAMGKQAEYLSTLDSLGIQGALLAELDAMYRGQASKLFIAAHIENWTVHPYIKGAYSYSKVGIGKARVQAASSLENKVFFAGEAMNLNGHHQTVHGAMETALTQVNTMLQLF